MSKYKKNKFFRFEWLVDPAFSEWLQKVKDEEKAYCKICNKTMRAHKFNLMRHNKSDKHILNSFAKCDSPGTQIQNSNSLTDSLLSTWIQEGKNKAYCKLCRSHMSLDRHSIQHHIDTSRHKTKCYIQLQLQQNCKTSSVHDNLCDEESPKIELIIPKNDPEELLKATIETSSIHDNLCDEESPKMELIIPKNDPEVLLNATIEAFRPKRIVPLRDKILIEMNQTDNSMSENSQVVSGKVIAVGSGFITEAGELLPMSVDVGDEVLLPVNGGTKMNSDGKEYFFFKDSDILAKYEMDYD